MKGEEGQAAHQAEDDADAQSGSYDVKRGLRPRIRAVGASRRVKPQCIVP